MPQACKSKALLAGVSLIALLTAGSPALAQSVTATGDVSPPLPSAASWHISSFLSIGDFGTGTLTIADGGSVSSGDGFVGRNAGSEGNVTVTGTGSTWNDRGNLYLGDWGKGTLIIANGGSVSNFYGYLGLRQGSEGSATVTGTGSAWINDGPLVIGYVGTGKLTIEDGGSVSNSFGIIGVSTGSDGMVTVTGAGSLWNSADLLVGNGGAGQLNVESGGTVRVIDGSGNLGRATIAIQIGSTGKIFLNGTVGARGVLQVGQLELGAGTGNLFFDGGVLQAGADQADFLHGFAPGEVTINAGGAFIDSNGFDIGIGTNLQGTGGLTKLGAGTLTLTGDSSYDGDTRVDGGALHIAGGGSVRNNVGVIGTPGGSGGTVTVSADALWQNLGGLYVGDYSPGSLNIEAGGTVTNTSASIGNSAASGSVTVSGANALWENQGNLLIGNRSTGTLTIAAGGTVRDVKGAIGNNDLDAGVSSAVTVSGANALWENSAELYVGNLSTGALAIKDGGTVTNTAGYIGNAAVASGAVTVSGTNAKWENSESLTIGHAGTGTLTIADGGVVSLDNGGGSAAIAQFSGATGTLNIGAAAGDDALTAGTLDAAGVSFGDGIGTLVFNHTGNRDGSDYVFAPSISGTSSARINQIAGTTVLTNASSGFNGTTTVSGGTLLSNNVLGGTVDVEAGGTLGGSGTVGTTAVAAGGHLAPGSGAVGTLTVAGDLTLSSGAILNYELGGPGAAAGNGVSDRIDVSGNLALTGTLNLTQSGDPGDGAAGFGYYRLMTYGTLSGGGLTIGTTPALAGPATYEILTGGGNVDLFIAASGTPGDDSLQHWQGGNGTWNGTNTQWLNQSGDIPVAWANNHAVFKNEPGGFDGGAITVEGGQSFKGLQFVDEGYRLEGPGQLIVNGSGRADGNAEIRVLADRAEIVTAITGTGGITKTQDGTLILSGQNTYQGGTIISSGTLQVSQDANLGAASGGLINGGTLATTASFDTNREVELTEQSGRFEVASDTVLGLKGSISGAGSLVKQGDGTLVLSGSNTYQGLTVVLSGTLIGDTSSIRGDVASAGTVIFDQASDATFAGGFVGSAGVYGSMIKRGGGTLTLDYGSALDWTVEAGGLISVAERFHGNVAIGASGAFTFDQLNDASYAGILSGAGSFTKAGRGSLLMSGDSSGFTGTTTISGGLLSIGGSDNAALGGSLRVLDGGTLGGIGTIGSGTGSLVTIASGGTLSPGNSIGTLTVNGNLVFDSGSRFAVEVNPDGTDSDLVHVTGNATLNGGSVAHIGIDGNYALRSTYTILRADGTLSGAFNGVTSDFAFLTPELAYDYGARTISLDLARNDRDFASASLTRNQIAAAGGIESIGFNAGNPVYDAIALLPDDTDLVRASFDALSGEVHATAKTALIEDSRFLRNAANDRIRAAFAMPGASFAPVLAYGEGGPVLAPATTDRFAVWSQGFGSWGSFNGDGNAAGFDTSTGGFLMGADAPLGDWRLGLMAGYSQTSFDVNARRSSGSSDNYHLGLYGGTQWGNLGFRSGLAYTWHDLDTSRSVSIPGLADRLTGGYDAGTFQAFGELGYRIDTPSIAFEPFANLAYVSLHTDGFTENGGAAALTAAGETTDTTFTTLGLRASTGFSLGTMQATARGMLGWRHAFGDTTPLSTQAFAGSDAFTVAGVPIAKDAAVFDAGFDLNLTANATLGVSYQGQFGGGASQNGFKANLAVKF